MEKKWEEIYALISAGSYPSGYDKAQRQNLRRYASKFNQKDGELFVGTRRVVKTMDDARKIFHEFHSAPIGGHTGTHKTLNAVCSRFYWFGMTVDIKTWILECDQCQKVGKPLTAVQPLQCIQSFPEESLVGSDMDYEPVPGPSRPRSRMRGAPRDRVRRSRAGRATASTTRGSREQEGGGRVRGRRRVRGQARTRGGLLADLTRDDLERVQQLRQQLVAVEEARINRLTLEECQQLLQRCLTREPSLIFDLMSLTPDHPQPGPCPPQSPSWCVCLQCRNMATLLEQKCCQQQPQNCTSLLPHMDLYILNEGALRLARRIWNDLRAEADIHEPGESHRQFRYAAYRNFIVWQYGLLGTDVRIVIPSCCVWKIRDRFPDPNGQYVSFLQSRV
uniref:Gypsy retrotransposon integrase-like protein 1 n=2 Tax=Nothobranchius kadleci TaxID=1051664 RepID=A0A1A8CCW0_NOTKA